MGEGLSTHSTDREDERNQITAQQTYADRERARRAREEFEKAYEARIQEERQAAGCCILCGEPLNALARLRRARQHLRCTTFSE